MPVWHRTVRLTGFVQMWKDGRLTIPELAEQVVQFIRTSGWLADTPYPDTLNDHLNELLQATTREEYEAAFDLIYDVADEDRVWIETT